MKKKISIEGMSCQHCVNHVTEALKELEGVDQVEVSLEEKRAIIESAKEIADADIKNAIEEVGYEVVEIEALS